MTCLIRENLKNDQKTLAKYWRELILCAKHFKEEVQPLTNGLEYVSSNYLFSQVRGENLFGDIRRRFPCIKMTNESSKSF